LPNTALAKGDFVCAERINLEQEGCWRKNFVDSCLNRINELLAGAMISTE